MAAEENFRVSDSPTLAHPGHQSPRLEKPASAAHKEVGFNSLLPSPSPSRSLAGAPHGSTRQRRNSDNPTSDEEGREPKRRRIAQEATTTSPLISDPITHWVHTLYWPKSDDFAYSKMSAPESRKRKSSSTRPSDRQQALEENNVHFQISFQSPAQLQQESKDLCKRLLDGDQSPDQFPGYPIAMVPAVLNRVRSLNEARLQRDVTPWVVPSPENLVFSGELAHTFVGEEVQAEWSRCEPMGVSKPKPDLTIGLQRSAFDNEEWAKLDNHVTSLAPFYCTPNLWFPFLICEAKTGQVGLDTADLQNIHSGSIAVRSILRVCITAYGRYDEKVKELLGHILVFSLSHNNDEVRVYGHYAMAKGSTSEEGENLEYFRHAIAKFSLGIFGDGERYKAYNFVRNVYEEFALKHRNRLRDAIRSLAAPGPRAGSIHSASEPVSQDEGLVQNTSVQQEATFKTPSEPASGMTNRLIQQMEKKLQQMERQMKQMEKKQQETEQQLAEERRGGREREGPH